MAGRLSLSGQSIKLQPAETRAMPSNATRIHRAANGVQKSTPPGSGRRSLSPGDALATSSGASPTPSPSLSAHVPAAKGKLGKTSSLKKPPVSSPPVSSSTQSTEVPVAVEPVTPVSREEHYEEQKVDVVGSNVVTYSHYKDSFCTRNEKMAWADIDEKYCLSFVFKGNFKTTLVASDGTRVVRNEEGFFDGLCDGVVYALEVEADPEFPIESKPLHLSRRGDPAQSVGQVRVQNITDQLKAMSADELREQGPEYKRLLEERELEEMLGSH